MNDTISAIILAGGRISEGDPFYEQAGPMRKTMLPIAGKPMVQWVIEAIEQAESVSSILVVGLDQQPWFGDRKPIISMPDAGSMLKNIKTGLEAINSMSEPEQFVLLASGDIPTITPQVVDWRVQNALEVGADINYAVVTRETMEARFPHSQRSYVKLRDMTVCGGDLNVLRASLAGEDELWERIIAARKSAWRQASLLGYDLLLQLLLRRVSLQDAGEKAGDRLGIHAVGIVSPYAELAMDVDKPSHLEVVERAMRAEIN